MPSFKLSEKNAVETDLLVSTRDFGSENAIEKYNITIDIGEKPLAKNLKTLYELRGTPLPAELAVFKSYDLWLITFSVNIPHEGDFRKLKEIQLDLEYLSPLEGQKPPVTIIDLLPQTKFTKIVDGKFVFDGGVDITGQVSVPAAISLLLQPTDLLTVGGKIEVSTETNIVCNISFTLLSNEIVSFGIGNYAGGWVLRRTAEQPLLGDQLLVQTILTPQDLGSLTLRARVSAVATGPFGLLPIRLQSDWEFLDCNL